MGKTREVAIFFFVNSYSLWSKIPGIELPLKSSPLKLFLFQMLVFCSEVIYTLVADADQVLRCFTLTAAQWQENTIYALNQIRQCQFIPEELEISETKIFRYTKEFPKEINATKCLKQHQREKWHCGHNDLRSIDHTIAGITSDLVISPEQWWSLEEETIIYLADQFLRVKYVTKKPILITDGSTSDYNGNHCTAHGWITRGNFFLHMQRTTLNSRMSTGKDLSHSAQVLPCALEELGCETISLDPSAYIWYYPDNCVLSVVRTEDVNMVKQNIKYYIIGWPNSNTKLVFEDEKNSQKHSGKPTNI